MSGPLHIRERQPFVKRIRQAPRQRSARTLIVSAAVAVTALVAACGSPTSTGSASTGQTPTSPSAVGYSACVRSHGVPNFPDPDRSGQLPKTSAQQLGVSGSRLQAALTACRSRLPSSSQPGPPTQASLQQAWSATRNFAQCMRARGLPNWPGPTSDPSHHPERPTFNLPAGIDQDSPHVTTKIRECAPLLHGWDPYVTTGAGPAFLNLS
jgi:hypothetical protein